MNLGEIRTLAAQLCEDPNQTQFTQTQYADSINKADKQFAFDSKALYKDSAIVMVVNTASYSLPSDFTLEKSVTLNGIDLSPISRATLKSYKNNDRWDDDKGTPRFFMIDPEEAKKKITLYPIPSSDQNGISLVLTYYPVPTTMTGDTSIPLNSSSLMVQFHTGLAAYAAWLLMFYLPQTPEISQKRRELLSVYSTKVGEAIQTFGNTKSEPIDFHVQNVRAR